MIFRPAPDGMASQRWATLLLLAAVTVGSLVAAFSLGWDRVAFLLLLSGLVLAIPTITLALRVCRLATLRYLVDRNSIVIRDCFGSIVVPMCSLERVKIGGKATRPYRRHRRWPVPFFGIAPVDGLGFVFMAATLPPEEQVYLITTAGSYGVSPNDEDRFVQAVEERFRLGPTRELEGDMVPRRWREWLPSGICFWVVVVGGGVLWLYLLALDVWQDRRPGTFLLGAGVLWFVDALVGTVWSRRSRKAACAVWLVALAVLILAWRAMGLH